MSVAATKILMGAGGTGPPSEFSISPNFDSKSSWDLSTDGALNIGAHGQYTIQPTAGDITVDIEIWGGGGAIGWQYSNSTGTSTNTSSGGAGGFAGGRLVLKDGINYILQIGEGGAILTGTAGSGSTATATYEAGGVRSNFGGQAGGYTAIFKGSVNISYAMLIAGGGGAGGDSAFTGAGGAGGGTNGESAGSAQGGGGGTQTDGGAKSAAGNNPGDGGSLFGGHGQSSFSGIISPSGGGGFYGGGGANVGGGGGGSGYYNAADSDLTNETLTAGSGATPGNSGGSNRGGSGNGGTSEQSSSDGRIYIALVT